MASFHFFRQNNLLAWVLPQQEERFIQAEINLLSRVIIIAVVAWVLSCAIFGQEINLTLMGIVIIALLRPLFEKVYVRVRKE